MSQKKPAKKGAKMPSKTNRSKPAANKKVIERTLRSSNRLFRLRSLPFIFIFALIGSYFLYQGFATTTAPTTPPAVICGNNTILGGGPVSAPSGAITIPAGDNSNMVFTLREANKVFWFAPGVHTLGGTEYSQIEAASGSTYIGAPGAIIDGQNINRFAFTQQGQNVTIKYLTIRNFKAPLDQGVVNHDSGPGWTVEYNSIVNNQGAGLMAGDNNTYRFNCIQDNGQYGINAYSCNDRSNVPRSCGSVDNFVLENNEIAGNNTGNHEINPDGTYTGCGCTGGIKFWINNGATVRNNWVHDNKSVGVWLDNNNRGFIIENNYIENNSSEGMFIEAGYDAMVRYNTFKRNAIVKGREFQSRGDPFPIAAIYISENGAPSGYGLVNSPMLISNNYFEDNWAGVAMWENSDRYSSSTAHTHPPFGTIKTDLYDDAQCETATENDIPDSIDKYRCRWSTENTIVENNEFHINKTAVGAGCEGGDFCGINGIFSNYGSYPEFTGYTIPWRVTFQQNNIFRNNRYFGDWKFQGFQTSKPLGLRYTWQEWIAPAPNVPSTFTDANRPTSFGQDVGSTLNGSSTPPPPAADTTPPIVTLATPPNGSVVTGNVNLTANASDTVGVSRVEFYAGTTFLVSDTTSPYSYSWNSATVANGSHSLTAKAFDAANNSATSAAVSVTTSNTTSTPPPPTSAGNHLDTDTASLEASSGQWTSWFSASVARSTEQAHSGAASLRVDITAPNGWGVQLNNWPGFNATAGSKRISFWGRLGSGAMGATMKVKWRDANNVDLQTDTVLVGSLTSSWQEVSADVTAPAGTVKVYVELVNTLGTTGDYLYVDDVLVGDRTTLAGDTSAPSAPTGLSGTAASSTQVNLSWGAATDSVGVTDYYIVRNNVTIAELGNVTSYEDKNAQAGTSYSYYVYAGDAAKNYGPASNTINITTPAPPDTTPPSVPTNVAATAVSSSQVSLTWNASTDNVGVTGYAVFRNGVQIGITGGTSFGDATVNAGATYSYTLAAYDAANNRSAQSAPSNITIPYDTLAPTVTISTPANGSTVGRTSSAVISASASDNFGVTKMEVYIDNSLRATSTTGVLKYKWNTRNVSSGSHTITVKAYDAAGNVGTSSVTVYK